MSSQQLAAILSSTLSLNAEERRQAEKALVAAQSDSAAFAQLVLQLVQDAAAPKPVRQSAALNFKNWIRANWALEEAPTPLSSSTAETLKANITSVMVALSSESALQIQIGEAISIMAESDFPDQWPGLIDQLVSSLSATDFVVNNAVLQTAHSIFRNKTDSLLSSQSLSPEQHRILLHTLLLLLQIFFDLTSQDLPEFFESRMDLFMGLLLKYLDYTPPSELSQIDEDDEEAGDLEKVKAEICDIASLYALRYLDAMIPEVSESSAKVNYLRPFVEKTWGLLTRLGLSVKYDILVAKATLFLGHVVKMPSQRALFESQQTLEAFCEKIVLPSMTLREFEEEMFEDDPPEFVRRDLESTAGSETRRQAASDFIKALMEHFDSQVTAIVTQYVGAYLSQYASDPKSNWRSKDTALYLLMSIASRGSTTTQGVTSTNALVDVIKFFSENVLGDLQARPGAVHPIIQADAIKFLYTFRNQLTKDQLLSVLPLLIPHLENPAFVIHTYAAITIERILFTKQDNSFIFSSVDVRPYAEGILLALFKRIESGGTPQQVAANDHSMKAVMRVIITTRQDLAPNFRQVLQHLVKILTEISKNPSNPKFNHFTFEAISALIRFIVGSDTSTLPGFEAALFPPFHVILQQDVSEFTPFVFQILSQLLELQASNVLPDAYKAILPPLLTPTLWESKGNIPALVRLLRAFLAKGAQTIVDAGQLLPMLGIFQHLVGSKANDVHGFDLLESIVEFVPTSAFQQYISNPVFIVLLTRLQGARTDKFSQGLLRFICFTASIQKQGVGAEFVVNALDGVQPQPGLFGQVLPLLLSDVTKTPTKNRKIVAVGLANLLTQSESMLREPNVRAWTPTLESLLKLFLLPMPLSRQGEASDDIEVVDPEDIVYQASFSKLGAAEKERPDPVAYIGEPRTHLAAGLVTASQAHPGRISPLISAVASDFSSPFLSYMSSNGYILR